MKHALCKLILVLATIGIANVSLAQSYPIKPIHFVIGFQPGTVLDAVSRLVGNEMEKRLGQQILLEFKPGANGIIGAKSVVTAPADGYTFYYGNATSFHPLFNRDNAVFAGTDLAAVGVVVTAPYFFFSSAKLPAATYQQLVAYTKANPDSLTHGATSQTTDLLMQMLKDRTGVASRSIPYKSTPQVVTAMIVGEVGAYVSAVQPFLSHIKAGTIRALFITSGKRSPLLADVPTAAEVGVRNFEVTANYGLWAPVGTPRNILQRMSTEVATALKVPGVAERLRNEFGTEPAGSTPEEHLRAFEAETKFWTEAARLANFKPQ